MNLFAPSYYPAFRCIAGDCQHSCCIGWEIDIDPRTLARYRALPPRERKEILSHTVTQKGCTSFRLCKDERCPFLNADGLCRLILAHGEEILCDICREHPRFYHTYSDRTEVGLGLCCEEAARLILTDPHPFALICIKEDSSMSDPVADPFEAIFLSQRAEDLRTITDRTRPLSHRISDLLERHSLSPAAIFSNDSHWQAVYRSLEQLDPAWSDALTAWENTPGLQNLPDSVEAEQLIAYFFYRHLASAREDGRYPVRVAFALLSAHVICRIAAAIRPHHLPTLIDTARAYSAEIEYDEDNVLKLLETLEQTGVVLPTA